MARSLGQSFEGSASVFCFFRNRQGSLYHAHNAKTPQKNKSPDQRSGRTFLHPQNTSPPQAIFPLCPIHQHQPWTTPRHIGNVQSVPTFPKYGH